MIFTFLGQMFLVSHRPGVSDRLTSQSLWLSFLNPDFETLSLNYTYDLWSSFFSLSEGDVNVSLFSAGLG